MKLIDGTIVQHISSGNTYTTMGGESWQVFPRFYKQGLEKSHYEQFNTGWNVYYIPQGLL